MNENKILTRSDYNLLVMCVAEVLDRVSGRPRDPFTAAAPKDQEAIDRLLPKIFELREEC